jgi:predicted DNA-binding antitoxin AbrB/MazE fold protein
METLKQKILLSNGHKLKIKIKYNKTYRCKFVYLYAFYT